jgi:predicted nucleic acid-binding Zn ribbon protein
MMPTYEYRCVSNARVVEVQHKMSEHLHTWGELCARAGIAPGRTDPHAPVEKLMSAGFISSASRSAPSPASCALPMCGTGGCGQCD